MIVHVPAPVRVTVAVTVPLADVGLPSVHFPAADKVTAKPALDVEFALTGNGPSTR